MTSISQKHFDLVDAVNDARTEAEHRDARRFLEGFREGLTTAGIRPDLIACDFYSMGNHGEVEMVAGVLLNWKPTLEETTP